jgi:hypothetical protein
MVSDVEDRVDKLYQEVQALKSKGEVVYTEKLANPRHSDWQHLNHAAPERAQRRDHLRESIGMVLPVGLLRWPGPASGRHVRQRRTTPSATAFSSYVPRRMQS